MELSSGLIDVFADEPLSGNPLAVVENADALSLEQMKRIAGEFNQAETTFLMKSERADWKLMSFTANGSPVYGAGHNALGAWLWLGHTGQLGALDRPETFHQEIGDAILPIRMERRAGRIFGTMTQSPLTLGATVDDPSRLALSLGLSGQSILSDPPVRTADTGAGHLMVRVRDKEAVDAVRPDADRLLEALRVAGAEGCYVYSFDERQPQAAYARFFNPTVGLWEDAATGTAAGPLCAYLGHMGRIEPGAELSIEQGTLMGRQSFLSLRLGDNVELSGTGLIVLKGQLVI